MSLLAPTFASLLVERALIDGDRRWLLIPENPCKSDALKRSVTYAELFSSAKRWSRRMCEDGAQPQSTALVIHDNDEHFAFAFFGAQLAGLVPVPLAPPPFAAHLSQYRERLQNVISDCQPQFILTTDALRPTIEALGFGTASGSTIISPSEIDAEPGAIRCVPRGGDAAFIQYTSGSVSAPKGIELSHDNVLCNIHGIGLSCGVDEQDVVASWLPLFHDMGLIGALCFSLYWRLPLVLMPPKMFLTRPSSWLWAIDRFRATLSAAPNFAYQRCAQLEDARLEGIDLSSWRVALNGSEVVRPETLADFQLRFLPRGLRQGALVPAYGMAENALASTLAVCGSAPVVDFIDRIALDSDGVALPAAEHARVRQVTSVGAPLWRQALRIVDTDERVLPERYVGEIQVRGPSVMQKIYGRPDETAARKTADGWLRTGDRGYLAGGNLYVTGRLKDVIKKNGASLDATDIEAAAARTPSVREGGLVAIGIENALTGTEDLALLVETRLHSSAERQALKASLIDSVHATLGTRPDIVRLVPPQSLPKTTSGKPRRLASRELFLRGAFADE
jgi:acyl-CoA synthetase (AMP-forming)/AMP-acid ligase II